jgi:L-threonylcarbamoyladenylate synthase
MRHLTLTGRNLEEAAAEAAAMLLAGELVALPTETVYGLAADAANGKAVARIFAAKGRPRFNPLICHVTGIAMAARYGQLDKRAERVAEKFWPGPLSLVVPTMANAKVHPLVTADLPTIAIRAPRGPARAVIEKFGAALAAPSANRSGRISPTRAEHVIEQLGDAAALVLDAGPCEVGLESTIVCLAGERPRLLRSGGVPTEAIEEALGDALERPTAGDSISAPGMLASHYAPDLPLRLNADTVRPGEALLAFGNADIAGVEMAATVLNLSPAGDLIEAAANLFSFLRDLDRTDASGIAVMHIPRAGIGEAINDRLERASAPKPSQD